jgi:predicted CXXCH cytochrome family protein
MKRILAPVLLMSVLFPALRSAAVPPLSLDGYRDEKLPTGRDDSSALKELNGACYVCHGNYRTESLVVRHAKEKVGCAQCHGQSLPHQADETHRTPPEKMYPAATVDRMCTKCHEEHRAAARKVIQRWQQRCPSKTNPLDIVCTDCHFEHRLSARTMVWDKQTGKLITESPRTKKAGGSP